MWLRIKSQISQDDASVVLCFLNEFGWQLMALGDGTTTTRQQNALNDIPRGIDTVEKWCNLSGRTTLYAICPSCHCTYKPEHRADRPDLSYPSRCSYASPPGSAPCGAALLDDDGDPFKTFTYHSFHDHVGCLISRPDLRAQFRRFRQEACQRAPTILRSIQDGSFVRILKGVDGRLFMDIGDPSDGEPEQFRLVWSLNVDGFLVEGANMHGAHRSATAMSMACLSADGSVRFDSGVLYLAAIWPDDPGKDYHDHYVKPLVDDLVESWEKGIRYIFEETAPLPPSIRATQTFDCPEPEIFDVRCALAAMVTDSPAGRKLMGFAPIRSHHFCFVCDVSNLAFLGRTDFENWAVLDDQKLRELALRWAHGGTAVRKLIYEHYGLQYSVMWRLQYLRPALQLIVEGMHGLFESACCRHALAALQLFDKKGKHIAPGKVACYSYPFELPPRATDLHDRGDMDGPVEDAHGPWQDPTQPDLSDIDMDIDISYDAELAFGGAPMQARTPDLDGPEASERRRQLQELRRSLTAKECNQVLLIHARLTAPLDDSQKPPATNDGPPRTPVEWLADGLSSHNKTPLEFVAVDLGLHVTAQNPSKSPTKKDYGRALAEWVCCALFSF